MSLTAECPLPLRRRVPIRASRLLGGGHPRRGAANEAEPAQLGVTGARPVVLLVMELAADLRALQRVGQPGAQEVALAGREHLGLGGQAPQRRGVQHPGAVARERRPAGALGGLGDPALLVLLGVAVGEPVVVERGPVHRSRP